MAQPHLERLGEATGETINLAVRAATRSSRSPRWTPRYLLGAVNWVGRSRPAALLRPRQGVPRPRVAALPEGRLERRTDRTLTTREALEVELAKVRERGYAVADSELEPGLVAVAAPVRGPDGAVVAALSVSGPSVRLSRRPASPASGALLVDEARRSSLAQLGYSTDHAAKGGRRMTPDEILKGLYDETLVGNAPAVLELTNQGLDDGMTPETMLFEALIPSLEEVGARFERGDFFVPEMLIAGKAMSGALDVLRPLLAETGAETVGKFLMGTVKGDVHDIGKNLVNIMLEGAGFEVIDLGVQVPPEKFVAAIEEHKPDIVGFSAFLTTTMPMFKANINALEKAGLRDQVIVMVGGAPVTQEYADAVGADGYAADASTAVRRAKELHRSASAPLAERLKPPA